MKMNKLYRTLFLGSHIPHCIMLIYYFTRFYPCYFLMSGVYFTLSAIVLIGRPVFNKSIRHWVMVKRAAELSMIISFIFRSTLNSELFTILMFGIIWGVVTKLPTVLQTNIEKPAVYVTLMMLFITQASILAQVAGVFTCFLVVHETISKKIDLDNMDKSLRHYFNIKLLRIYMFFIIEWTLTRLNEWALLFILTGSVLFNAYAYFSLEHMVHDIHTYSNVNALPSMYPIPLNIKDACAHCVIAKEVFKDHNL